VEKLTSILAPDEGVLLRTTYVFLRRIESVLRRVSNNSISQLPSSADDLRVLAIRMGFASQEEFLGQYTAQRRQVERIIEKHFEQPS
jgi:glutamine synthetase adenylyltransferase